MKHCPFCAEEIQDAAIVCKHCGRDLVEPIVSAPPNRQAKSGSSAAAGWLLFVVLGIIGLGIILTLGTSTPGGDGGALLSAENLEKAKSLVAASERAGHIVRYSCVGNEAFVNPVAWASMNIDEKRGMTISLAAICESRDSGGYMTLFDHQSGRRLAALIGGSFEVF